MRSRGLDPSFRYGRRARGTTQQKISGRLRSDKAARDRYAIRGYASTAAKHGIGTLAAIRDALAGSPWMPSLSEWG